MTQAAAIAKVPPPTSFKIPESVLVVIYTPALEVLLLERADHPGFWQSVTGSRASLQEPLTHTCAREVKEETGYAAPPEAFDNWRQVNRYAIYPHWRHRYAPGITHNTEHVFGLAVAAAFVPQLAAREHARYQWLPWRAAADRCFSWTNAQAIRLLPDRARR
ncbi:MAG: dihydroneopterin triphosphate diphosphatase [Sutterellaceae bacterium]|nr:dihydroneopterin triphosphate diphosphatase [Burkholderiaceae bacterium]MCX7901140.1 dihydroneopterin triphosphate diphosphatase [Burkholderiaceae bacterium]MDW8430070.1 dihydroneopterin triphosphate diphosphatase [Sutterellaceae bacterium]